MSVWGTSDPTGLTGDTDASYGGTGGGNTLEVPQQTPQFSPFSPSLPVGSLGDILSSISPGSFDPNSLGLASGGGSGGGILSVLSSLLGGGGSGDASGPNATSGGAGGLGGISSLLGPLLSLFGGSGSSGGGLSSGALGDILGSVNPGAFDATTQGAGASDILGGFGGSAGSFAGGLGLIQGLLGPINQIRSGGQTGPGGITGGIEGGLSGAIQGGISGEQLGGPYAAIAAAIIEGVLGGLSGSGTLNSLNKFAKPQALSTFLGSSGNPLEELLGKYIQKGINQGFDLSESSPVPFKPNRFGDVLELLSGQGLPNLVGGNLGFQNPVQLGGWKNLSEIQQLLPNANLLSQSQLAQIFPEISRLVNKSGKESLAQLLQQENTLAGKLKAAESF